MIKLVAQAIPTYCMSTFLLPETLGEEMKRMLNSFWWGSGRGRNRGINWLSWEKITIWKEYRGMGVHHFYGFNIAMLQKKCCRLLTNPDAIISRVFKPNTILKEFFGARLDRNPNYVWCSIHNSQVLVKKGARKQIGNGRHTNIWNQPWIRNDQNPYISTAPPLGMEGMCVRDLISQQAQT